MKNSSIEANGMPVEEYAFEFNNLFIRVGFNGTNEQITSGYISLNQSIRD